VEFSLEALEDLEDLPAIAKQLKLLADEGRIACGQPDPSVRELEIARRRILYRQRGDELEVITAEPVVPARH
jgi:hypothetical protein